MAHEVTDFTMEMVNLLEVESERGCVLVAAAYFEDSIRRSLCAFCKSRSNASDKELNKLFKTFDSQFANFASCIRLARALDLITETGQQMLVDFAVWRNSFAHGTGNKEITEEGISSFTRPWEDDLNRAAQRKWGVLFASHSLARRKFEWWAAFVLGDLQITIDEYTPISSPPHFRAATEKLRQDKQSGEPENKA